MRLKATASLTACLLGAGVAWGPTAARAELPVEGTHLPAGHAQPADGAPAADPTLPVGYEAWFPPEVVPLVKDERHTPARWWLTGEYLLWWFDDHPVPTPLVTTRPDPVSTQQFAVLGESDIEYHNGSPGGRLTVGAWLNPEHTLAVEASGFLFGKNSEFARTASDETGRPPLDRPVVDPTTGAIVLIPVSVPDLLTGRVEVRSSAQLGGAEANLFTPACHHACFRLDLLGGVRYGHFREELDVLQISRGLPGAVIVTGAFGPVTGEPTFLIRDTFEARNDFYGGQLGLRAEYRRGPGTVTLVGKVALGRVEQELEVAGSTTVLPGTAPAPVVVGGQTAPTAAGGVLASGNLLGTRQRGDFAAVSEVGVNLGAQLNGYVRLGVGYSFTHWSSVVRSGEQLSNTADPTRIPFSAAFNPLAPAAAAPPALRDSDFSAHGLNFFVEFTF